MKWSVVFCLLLASTALARPRTKRSIGHLKSLIVNKLFGIGGKTVIVARPILSNNETYQLFRIPGIDDFFVKVSKNVQKHDKDEGKPTVDIKDPVIVKPEVAIIGSYLGTTTQRETLLAIEMVKNLVRTGILTGRLDSSMQELLVPQGFGGYIQEDVLTQPMQVITKEEEHIYVPEYPQFFAPPELKVTNPNSKYYYKQEGPDADMTYESHDNKDVLVTRTEKQTQHLQVSDAAQKNKNVGNIHSPPISQPLRINGPPYYVNEGMEAGRIPSVAENQVPLYNVNQGMVAGGIPLAAQNQVPLYNVNQGMPENIPDPGNISEYYVNQGTMSGKAPGNDQISPPGFYLNQGMISRSEPGKYQILSPGYFADQGMSSGNMPGLGQNPTPGYYVDQGIMSGQGKHPPTYYVNQGIATGGILGQAPYGAADNVNSGMKGFAQGHVGNTPQNIDVNPNLMPGYFGPMYPSVYYVNSGTVGGSLGQNPPYLSHGMGKPITNEIGLQLIGNDRNGGAIMADRNPPLQMDAVAHPYYFGNNAQGVIICKEKQDKACPYDKIQKIALNPTQNTNKPAVKQQSVSNINSTFGNAKKNVVKEFLKNKTVNGQIVTKYSYQQINSHSNKNYTEVKLSEPAAVETNKDLNKDFVYIPPGDSSIALSLKNEEQNEKNDKNAFTSKVNVSKEEIKRFMPSNRLKSNVRSNLKQNPIVVAEKRSNETDEKSTRPNDNNKGEIPGSTF